MGYVLPPAIQAGVDKLTEMVTAPKESQSRLKARLPVLPHLRVLLSIFLVPLEKQPMPYLT